MWIIPTKKEIKKEFEKVNQGFKERDNHIKNLNETIEKLKDKIETNSLKIATIEGAYSILYNKQPSLESHKSQVSVSKSLKESQPVSNTFETRIINKIRKNKKSLVMAEIMKLTPSYSVIEMFEKIVKDKGLCSKASFYRYIESLKSQGIETFETNETISPTPTPHQTTRKKR